MNLQPQMIVAIVVAVLGPILAKYGITNDMLAAVVSAITPIAAAIFAWWQTTHDKQIASTSAIPGVKAVVMQTDSAATSIAHNDNDKVIGPGDIPLLASKLPAVKAVVMENQATADAIPSPAVVGPGALKPAA